MAVFHRTALARELASKLLKDSAVSASPSGLFLAAPRRTGKSTFAREDLRPALQAHGAPVLYIDLWENKQVDPADIIVGAVRAALAAREGVVMRLAKTARLDKIAVGGLAFSLDKIGLGKEVSLSAALAALSDETQQMIVLIIDEAQHAISSTAGSDTLFALKAARDELNSSSHHGLRVVATGSNRDKLAMLRSGKDQAFFGAPMVEFPALGLDYIAWFIAQLPYSAELSTDDVFAWFRDASFRPEVLAAAVDALDYELEIPSGQRAKRLEQLVYEQIGASNAEALRVVHSLTPLQSSVLRVAAMMGADYAPFEQPTMERYLAVLAREYPDAKIVPDTGNVQQTLAALQEKYLVWRAARGVYALEDSSLVELMRRSGLLRGV